MPHPSELTALLRSVPYFAELPIERLTAVTHELRLRRHAKDEIIIAEGQRCDGLYIVVEGRVKVFKITGSGRQQVLRILGAGRTFNDVPVFDGGCNPGSVAALSACRTALLQKHRMLFLLRNEPAMAVAAVQVLANRLRALTVMVEDLALRGVTERIARLLLQGSASISEGSPDDLLLTQRNLAAMVGSVREVVNRSLKLLEQEGAIAIGRGRIEVLEPAILERWSAVADH